MKINRFVSGLAGIVLAACGQENNTRNNNNNNNNNSYDGGYSDSGYVDGGDVKADGGQGNLPPVVIIEAKDRAGNIKNIFNVGEWVVYDANKSYDPDCERKNRCSVSKGINYCEESDSLGNAGIVYFANQGGAGISEIKYGSGAIGKSVIYTLKCYDLDDNLSNSGTITISIQ